MDNSSAEVDYHSLWESKGQNCKMKANCSCLHCVEFVAIRRRPRPLVASIYRARTVASTPNIATGFAIAMHPSSPTDFAKSRGVDAALPYSRTSTDLGARFSKQRSEGLDQSKHCSKSVKLSVEVRSWTA